jgi:hexosaminidase
MKPISAIIFLFLGSQFLFSQSSIIPTPAFYQIDESADTLKFNSLLLNENHLSKEERHIFQYWLNRTYPRKTTGFEKSVSVQFFPIQNETEKDYYELKTTKDGIEIGYTSNASKLYAASSLIQLLEPSGNDLILIPFQLKDAPNFSWRGLHLDVSRHFFTVDEVKRYIDIMAFYKFNTFHWHLTDDQGWRIEIKKYPNLTQVGAFRDSTLIGPYVTNPTNWDLTHYGGFYTQEQIKEVVKYADDRNVTIVPEIEMPGHARAALASYPQYSCTGTRPPLIGYWGVFDEIFCSKPETIQFLQDILTEVLELFPSEYIHVGGDEAPKTRWKACDVCQNTIKQHNLKDEHELQSWFIRQMDDFLTKKGRKLIGWDEILEGGLSPNATVMSWQGEEGGITAANEQHEVVMSPVSHCYFDYYQGESKMEPLSIGGYLPLEKVYGYSPIPQKLPNANRKYIIGAQANLWTEYIATFDHALYMAYPRALALIQNLWVKENKPEYHEFTEILVQKQFRMMDAWKINYATSFANPSFEITQSQLGIVVEAQSNGNYDNITIQYPENNGEEKIYASKSNNRFVVQRNQVKSPINYKVIAKENRYNKELELTLLHHKGLGLNMDFVTTPHPNYSKNWETKLVDGVVGTRPWKGNQWIGFNQPKIEFSVMLDSELKYSAVTISSLSAESSWIYLPKTVEISVSKNNKKWKKIAFNTIENEQTKIQLPKKIKHVKFVFTTLDKIPEGNAGAGYTPFTFFDELIFE